MQKQKGRGKGMGPLPANDVEDCAGAFIDYYEPISMTRAQVIQAAGVADAILAATFADPNGTMPPELAPAFSDAEIEKLVAIVQAKRHEVFYT